MSGETLATLANIFWGCLYLIGAVGVICAGHEFVECCRIARDMRHMAKHSTGGRRRG